MAVGYLHSQRFPDKTEDSDMWRIKTSAGMYIIIIIQALFVTFLLLLQGHSSITLFAFRSRVGRSSVSHLLPKRLTYTLDGRLECRKS